MTEQRTRSISPERAAFLESIKGLSYEVLVARKQRIDAELGEIKAQLTAVKSRDTYADPQWYRAAENAARFKGWQSQTIQTEMGLAKRAEKLERIARHSLNPEEAAARRAAKEQRARTWERAFVNVAQRSLEPSLFEALCEQTHIETALIDEAGT